jgi:hypothetical protein
MKVMKVLSTVLIVLLFSVSADADWQLRRVRCNSGCGFTYQRHFVQPVVKQVVQKQVQIVQPQVTQKTETQTTVVNNLVGIPVPVTYNQPIQAQGTTLYGYSSVADAYGQVDMGLLYNQAARLTDQAQQLAGQASSDFATLVQAEGQNRSEVARILAQGQSARQALEAAAGPTPQGIQQRTFAFQVTQNSDGQLSIQKMQDGEKAFQLSEAQSGDVSTSVSDLLKKSCVACHSNGNTQGGLNLEAAISDAQQAAILNRVTTDDLGLRMPRNADGTAGQKLSESDIRLLRQVMGQ